MRCARPSLPKKKALRKVPAHAGSKRQERRGDKACRQQEGEDARGVMMGQVCAQIGGAWQKEVPGR